MTTSATAPVSPPSPLPPARWAVWAAWAAPLGVLPSAIWRAVGALGGEGHTGAESSYMLVLSVLSVGLAFLTVGLVSGWGERFPRWVPFAAARPVPARAVVRVARAGGVLLVLLTAYAVLNLVFHFVDEGPRVIEQEREYEQPEAWVGYLYLPGAAWGFLVLAVARDYARRMSGTHRGTLRSKGTFRTEPEGGPLADRP
ncbi:hypothetical protein ACQEU8_25975 [Streptomyces sp. CA-250714]|uniref:hypothetical protein n=1 Tax=Streptomyces sp. CA-250714 TaxID=3240060 RepID=UPI003D8D1BE6